MSKKKKLSSEISQDKLAHLESVAKRGGLDLRGLLNLGLTLAEWAIQQKEAGGEIASIHGDRVIPCDIESLRNLRAIH